MSAARLTLPGFSEIRREAGRYEVQLRHDDLPAFRVKVLADATGRFTAIPELAD